MADAAVRQQASGAAGGVSKPLSKGKAKKAARRQFKAGVGGSDASQMTCIACGTRFDKADVLPIYFGSNEAAD